MIDKKRIDELNKRIGEWENKKKGLLFENTLSCELIEKYLVHIKAGEDCLGDIEYSINEIRKNFEEIRETDKDIEYELTDLEFEQEDERYNSAKENV
jgi:hypothetical protein